MRKSLKRELRLKGGQEVWPEASSKGKRSSRPVIGTRERMRVRIMYARVLPGEKKKEKERGKYAPYRGNGPTEPAGFLRVRRVKKVPAPIQLASKQRVVIAKRNAHWGEDEGRSRLSLFFVPTRVVPYKSKGWSPSNDSERDFSMHRSNEHREKNLFYTYVRTYMYRGV